MTAAYRRISRSPRPRTMVCSDLDADDPRQLELFGPNLDDYDRPRTRGDCLPGGCNAERPCPWVSCRHHLYLDVLRNGSIKLIYPHLEPSDLTHSCALDLIDSNDLDQLAPQGCSLELCAEALNLSPEHIRSLEALALESFRESAEDLGLRDEDDEPSEKNPAVVKVLRAVRGGCTTTLEISAVARLSLTATNWALSDLSELGEVSRTKVGRTLRVELVREPQPGHPEGATNENDGHTHYR